MVQCCKDRDSPGFFPICRGSSFFEDPSLIERRSFGVLLPPKKRDRIIHLASLDANWRHGPIGQAIERFAPQLLVTPEEDKGLQTAE